MYTPSDVLSARTVEPAEQIDTSALNMSRSCRADQNAWYGFETITDLSSYITLQLNCDS